MQLSINRNKKKLWDAIVKLFTLFIVFYLIVLLFSIDNDKKVDMPLIVSIIYTLSLLICIIDNSISLWIVRKEKMRYYFIGLVPVYIFILYKAVEYQEFFNYIADFYFTMFYGVSAVLLMIRYLIICFRQVCSE